MHLPKCTHVAKGTAKLAPQQNVKGGKLPSQAPSASPSPSSSLLERPAPKPKSQRRTAIDRIKELGWWWELGAVLVSFICMALIVTILFIMDGKPLRDWKLPIQPNSLVAIFSTVAKSALLVPVAESVGQLKWDHFHDRPRTVRHMQTFDEASRGPWGALTLLYRMRGHSVLAGFASAITVLMLAFEPFTQQIIQVHSQQAPVYNTIGIGGHAFRTDTFQPLPNATELPQGEKHPYISIFEPDADVPY
jgi:hypothetical protein